MASYGFGKPENLGKSENLRSDKDLAIAASGTDLVLTYKLKGSNVLMASRYRGGAWGDPVSIDQRSDQSPAIAAFGGKLYVLWQPVGSSEVDFGVMNPETLTVTSQGAVPIARTKAGVGAAAYGDKLYVLHIGETTGISGRNIFQATYDGTGWSRDQQIQRGQASKDAPVLASFPSRLFQVHRGETDGILGNTVYYSYNDEGGPLQWTENKQANESSAQQRPGAGRFGEEVVIVHNGNSQHDLRLVHSNQSEISFTGGDEIDDGVYVSTYGPALAQLGDKLYLVFSDRNDGDRLKVGVTSGL